jgi:hypothetical protein
MLSLVSWASAAKESTASDVFIFPKQWKFKAISALSQLPNENCEPSARKRVRHLPKNHPGTSLAQNPCRIGLHKWRVSLAHNSRASLPKKSCFCASIDSGGGDGKAGRGRNLRFASWTAPRTVRENPHMPHDADLAASFAAILFQTSQDALDRVWTRSSSFGVAQRNPRL